MSSRARGTPKTRSMTCWPFSMMSGSSKRWRRKMSDSLTKRDQRDRSKINMHEDFEVKYWTKALGVSKDELQKAVDKVGNSAAAVRKQLAVYRGARYACDLWSKAARFFIPCQIPTVPFVCENNPDGARAAGDPCACNRSPDIDAGIEEPDASHIISDTYGKRKPLSTVRTGSDLFTDCLRACASGFSPSSVS